MAGEAERRAPLVAGVLLALPTLVAHYLPMSDLPLHEGVVGILRHYGDAKYFPPELYTLNVPQGNQLFHLLAWGLSYLVGTIWAMKLVVAAAQILIFWTGARLADHLGRTRWAVLLLAPLALGFTYFWGLVANLLGFAAFLGILPVIDRAAKDPTPRRTAALCGWLVLVFLAHVSVFAAALGFAATLAVAHPFDRKKTALRFVPVVFGPALYVVSFLWANKNFPAGQIRPPASFMPVLDKVKNLPIVLYGSHDQIPLLALFGMSVLAIVVLLVARVKSREAAPEAQPVPEGASALRRRYVRLCDFLLRYRFELTGACFALSFFVAPFQWNGATLLHERFLGPAWAIFVVCAAPKGDPPRISKLVAGVLPVAILLLSWPQFADADACFKNLDRVIAEIPMNTSVTLVSMDRPIYRTRLYSAAVGPARTVAERGGRMGLSLTISPISPVQIRSQYRWDEYDMRTLRFGSRALRPTEEMNRFAWIIGQSRDPAARELLIAAFKPDAEHVVTHGEWMLFRSTHPQISMLSPDTPPDPHRETILERVRYLAVKQAQGEPLTPPDSEEGAP